ncbi:hypothetical protein RJC99_24030, partial [Escherichia coli]|nr:hypothetical protein [Escherichia coli]
MQITEALISEPGDIRRFVQQAVDHWPHLLAVHFTLDSAEGNIDEGQIHAFCTAFYRKRKLTAVCSHQTRIGNL